MTANEKNQNNEPMEIIQGMTVEEMTAMFFDNALVEPPYKVWQINSKGHRYYYRFNEEGIAEFFPSVTTILSQTMPTPPHLVKWIADKGYENAEAYKMERAAYGTFMHAQFEDLIINRCYDLDTLKEKLKDYMQVNRLPDEFIYYADDLKKDVLAFAQFVIDYDVKPIAVEISLVHPTAHYAGMIDLPCTMRDPKDKSKRINAIVDFKSGRKGFFEEHEIQLHLYRDMWNANFADMQIDKVFNFSPKDWRKKPTYNLKDQTDSPNAKKIPYILEIAAIEDKKRDNVFTSVSGMINLDMEVEPGVYTASDLSENVISLTLAELVKTKTAKEETPSDEVSVKDEDITENTENEGIETQKGEEGINVPREEEKPTCEKNDKNNLLNEDIDV